MKWLHKRRETGIGRSWLWRLALIALSCPAARAGWIIGPEHWIASENYMPSEDAIEMFEDHIVVDGPMPTLRLSPTELEYIFTYWKGIIRFRGPVTNPFQTKVDHIDNSTLYPTSTYLSTKGVLAWMLNVYKAPNGKELLGFLHIEDLRKCVKPYDKEAKYRIGLAYTNQGSPTSWSYVDDIIITPHHDTAGDGIGLGNNLAGLPFIIKNDSIYLYFQERVTLTAQNPPLITDPIVGVAKASRGEVLANAAQGTSTEWKKYYQGAWNEPGLHGKASNVIPNCLSDVINPHSDAAYCKPLGKYLILAPAMSTDRLIMYSSADGITWGDPVTIDSADGFHHEHCFFAATADATEDCREVGSEFYIIFPRRKVTQPAPDRPISMHYKKITFDPNSTGVVYKQAVDAGPLVHKILRR
jgi:hypothetical protein